MDPFSFDMDGSFREASFSENEFSKMRIGWLRDMNGRYFFEDGILHLCEEILKQLEDNSCLVDDVSEDIDTNLLWEAWTTLRSRNVYL